MTDAPPWHEQFGSKELTARPNSTDVYSSQR